jgi:hypothetical protein
MQDAYICRKMDMFDTSLINDKPGSDKAGSFSSLVTGFFLENFVQRTSGDDSRQDK